MNYLGHAYRFLAQPYVMAGACLPDWLRVIDRKARVPHAGVEVRSAHEQDLLRGVQHHHHDDRVFHTLAVFDALTTHAVKLLRALSPDPRFRASTIGHVLVEMLLDAALMVRDPSLADMYYRSLAQLDANVLADFARHATRRPLPDMQSLLERFAGSRFLFNYATDDGVERNMNGVLGRLGLPYVPPGFAHVVAELRPSVAKALPDVLAMPEAAP